MTPIYALFEELTGCCGVWVLHNFATYSDYGRYTIQETLKLWKGTWIATTIRSQRCAASALSAAGFVAQPEFRNPTTGAYVTLWLKAKPQRKRATRKKKEPK